MRSFLWIVLLIFSCTSFVRGSHPDCNFRLELQKDEAECYARLRKRESPLSKGCKGLWDNISCWDRAEVGETITIPCPRVLKVLFGVNGFISKNCTSGGWSEVFPNITSACGSEGRTDTQLVFYSVVKALYTLGHSLSLIALSTGSAILCLCRKLHCTRNYIHLNLFLSFILRAVAVLVKDHILFSHNAQCSEQTSMVRCKASLVVFHYFIMANFFWLLVEGLYLHTLLVVIFTKNRHFLVYLLIGWGFPTVFVFAWTMTRIYFEDTGCWEMNDNLVPLWVINGPIMFSIMVNFILFVSIIRILVQKVRCPDVGGTDQSQYWRLAKSTLLLIPLFGVHYVIFMSLNESLKAYKIFFDLALGSFQGLIVAILYCFLNSEVQAELKRKWRGLSLECLMSRHHRRQAASSCPNGTDKPLRAQSVLQTETTIL